MSASVVITNPLEDAGWNNHLASSPDHSFFHTSNWARVLHETYGYQPVYAATIENGVLLALIPVMEVRSILTGRRGVSLPFTDYCEPLSTGEKHLQSAMDSLREYGKNAGWKYIEFRGDGYFDDNVPCFGYYYGHRMSVAKDAADLLAEMRNSTRRNIKKAQKSGVRIEIATSMKAMTAFYRLHVMTRRMHGLPPQPFSFFRNIHEYIISENLGLIILAFYKEKCISGAVYFHFNGQAFYKYGASNRIYQELRASNLVMWEAINWYSAKGFHTFCFGRTDTDATGLRQFKNGWGAEEWTIKYYRYAPGKERFLGTSEPSRERGYGIFTRMPLPMLLLAGRVMYRHMG
ncbi:MAG: GNAT family N-acetyltransferase [Deltaproteobacteria bacterium]|nr:GNAT family N-acetyltransferase [Deltaproteobacteria bacterium]TLN00827.1 MAG: GNAT family N-acetyltransferase [bacterium]